MSEDEKIPLIFDIRHFALDDGPGIRTTVFLKGCPLSCVWCQNPESMKIGREIAFYPRRCIGCGDCKGVCPEGAIDLELETRVIRTRCTACGACAEACPANALKVVGRTYGSEELADILLDDRIFYETSRGGVTFSGGEPTLHMDYLVEVMDVLKENGIHTALQTSGVFDLFEFNRKLLPLTDLIFYDLKVFDPEKHRMFTGRSNERIFRNLSALLSLAGEKIVPRIPLIPGFTADRENLGAIASFLRERYCSVCELLSYNPGCTAKRRAIGENASPDLPEEMPTMEEETRLREFFSAALKGG